MKYLYSIILCALLIGCTNSNQSIIKTDDDLSAKISLQYENYVANDFSFSDQYSENVVARINNTVIEGKDNLMTGWKAHHEVLYSNINIEEVYIHTNHFVDGAVWTNAWLTWSGKGQTTGEEYTNRAHFDYKWEEGKIVELLAYFDETAENGEIAAYTASLEN
tara:strand:+ start:391 stop:879 length:489 start_codon:yes stop_codon:yes gene_type:complete